MAGHDHSVPHIFYLPINNLFLVKKLVYCMSGIVSMDG
jgi:hypothetical protein